MATSEKMLSFYQPPVISSSEMTTEILEFYPQTSQRVFTSNDVINISIGNLNKAQFILAESTALCFDVLVSTTAAPTASASFRPQITTSCDDVPRPAWGCPYFSNSEVQVPGSASFSCYPSSSNGAGPYFYSSRLLASSCSSSGASDRGCTFALPGRYGLAGGKSGLERVQSVCGPVRVSAGGTVVERRGQSISYAIPMSAFCTLFSKSTSLICGGMLSSGGEAISMSLTVANLEDICGAGVWSQSNDPAVTGYDSVSVKLINVRVVASIVRLQNPRLVSQLSSLYDGRVKLEIPLPTGGVQSIAVPMVIKHQSFIHASAIIPATPTPSVNSTSAFSLTFSGVNHPAVSGILIRARLRPNNGSADSKLRRSLSTLYLGADEPRCLITRLMANLNDINLPLNGISDIGATGIPVYSNSGVPVAGASVVTASSSGMSSILFDLARGPLGLYMEESHQQSLTDVVFDKAVVRKSNLLVTGANVYPTVADYGSYTEAEVAHNSDKYPIAMWLIPLTTLPAQVGDFSDAGTIRAFDLRSISSFSVTGNMSVISSANDETRSAQFFAPSEDVVLDGTLICHNALRIASGSSDSRYIFSMVANATVASS